jgi:hypothetical protein
MIPDTDLDTLLAAPDEDVVPADDGFDHALMRRVERRRARRRLLIGATGGLSGTAACVAFAVLPAPAVVDTAGDAGNVISILLLVGLCAMAWVGSVGARVRRGSH